MQERSQERQGQARQGFQLSDGKGLFLLVKPQINVTGKLWRFKYRPGQITWMLEERGGDIAV